MTAPLSTPPPDLPAPEILEKRQKQAKSPWKNGKNRSKKPWKNGKNRPKSLGKTAKTNYFCKKADSVWHYSDT
ncbi:hypothetical protein [Duncaniella muris]|uniref:hypothetical protein n=1 Tax=Duncaniella muris TaxID=2094150 RepID=UPI00272AEE86|nr:hypothetical protein [Duncaniella muris]